MFTAALNRVEQVPFYKLNAGDTANAWYAALPVALTWLWQQLAAPDLRVLFPVRSQVSHLTTLPVRPVKARHHGPCAPAARPGSAGLPALPCAAPSPGQAKHAVTAARA